ncbi:MAG: alpha/beta hydrolase family protein [Janthinobacterium lividum]
MRLLYCLLALGALLSLQPAHAQPKTPADFGYRHLTMRYKGDMVDVLVLSKKGEELKRKPVFLFVQGSGSKPVILYDEKGAFPMLPFETDTLLARYHFVEISKPGLPLVASTKSLTPNYEYLDPKTGNVPLAYCQRNYLEYYVARDAAVLRYLARQPWVQATDITAMGHSEGTNVVARLARQPGPLRRVVYLSGSPLGRMLTVISGDRQDADSVGAENSFHYWQEVVAAPKQNNCLGDTHLLVSSLSSTHTPLNDFRRSRIPVFVGYGTRDRSALLEDYLRLEMIRAGKTNFTFRAYPGLEHNFFGFTDGQVDHKKWNWDRVARDFFAWMKTH